IFYGANGYRHMPKHHSETETEHHHKRRRHRSDVYGEFIRTFTFSNPQLPIVQPGGRLIFPTPTVTPQNVRYVETAEAVGLLVPQGVYLVAWTVNPSTGATV